MEYKLHLVQYWTLSPKWHLLCYLIASSFASHYLILGRITKSQNEISFQKAERIEQILLRPVKRAHH